MSPSLQVPPGLMLAWASCGHMAESSKLNPLQKLVSSHHTGGQQESEPQSSLGSLPQFPLREGLEKVTVPWGGGCVWGLRHLPALGSHLWDSPCIIWAGNTPRGLFI